MSDGFDDGPRDGISHLNIKKIPKRQSAVALKDHSAEGKIPEVTAAGRGKIAEQIMELARENGINIRQDSALAEILTKIEVDSPIPTEAFMAVAEIMSYVYKASGRPNPFDAAHKNDKSE